ncbi:uncharacterized protein LOC135157887 [Lytechinus pictus]|uniref:uncharacterized protein LOC135157887 n=1 Tax=Lytechinus pictus TaxID=7653 RepID=UPI0030B9DFD0
MSNNTKLMFIPIPSPRRPTMPSTTGSIRSLGTSRGGSMSKSGDFTSLRTDDKRKDGNIPVRPALCLKDITKFDLMSPVAVQQLTGNFQSSFPTITGKETRNIKMLNLQLPKNPYATLPRLALTKRDDCRDVVQTSSFTHGLTRSHSELSHYRTRDSHRALLQDRPHTESRLTRRAKHGGPVFFSSRASTIPEESRAPVDSEVSSTSGGIKETEKINNRLGEYPLQTVESGTFKDLAPLRRAKMRSRTKPTAFGSKRMRSGHANTAEKVANLAMSAYTEVHANNGEINGQVWGGESPARNTPDGSRLVRFNTQNDVFEYTPGQCLR